MMFTEGILRKRRRVPRSGCQSFMWEDVVSPNVKATTREFIVGDNRGIWLARAIRRQLETERWNRDNLSMISWSRACVNVSATHPHFSCHSSSRRRRVCTPCARRFRPSSSFFCLGAVCCPFLGTYGTWVADHGLVDFCTGDDDPREDGQRLNNEALVRARDCRQHLAREEYVAAPKRANITREDLDHIGFTAACPGCVSKLRAPARQAY